MQRDQRPTTAQLRNDIDSGRTGAKVDAADPSAAPLGTDDEAAGSAPSPDRIEMARNAERKIGDAAMRPAREADDEARSQRDSSAPYAKEEHMNNELVRRSEDRERVDKNSAGNNESPDA